MSASPISTNLFAAQELGFNQRAVLNKMFQGWLDYHHQQKDKWHNLVKYRYMVSRIKLNKLFWAWKLQIRQQKVNRLKENIISHQIYKLNLKKCFQTWKSQHLRLKLGLKIFTKVGDRRVKKLVLAYMRFRNQDLWTKEHQLYLGKRFFKDHTKVNVLKMFKRNVALRKDFRLKSGHALQLYKHQMKRKYFLEIFKFSRMHNKKLESIAKVNSYLQQKYRNRVLQALKCHSNETHSKDYMIRQAMSFQIFRHKHYLKKQSFRVMKDWHTIRKQQKEKEEQKIRLFRMRKALDAFQRGLRVVETDEVRMVSQFKGQMMRLKFFSMWKKYLSTQLKDKSLSSEALSHYDRKLCQRIIGSMKQVLVRQRSLHLAGDQVKRTVETRILGTVLSRFNALKQVKHMRQEQLARTLQKIFQQHKKRSFVKMRNIVCYSYYLMRAQNFRQSYNRRKVLKILRQYQHGKLQQHINYQMSRKFRYMRLLQKGINSFRKAIVLQEKGQTSQQQAEQLRKRLLLKQGLRPFKVFDQKQKLKLALAIKFHRRQQKQMLSLYFQALNNYRLNHEVKRQKNAMAIVQLDNRLVKKYFSVLKSQIRQQLNSKRLIEYKEQRIVKLHERQQKQQIITQLKQNRRQSFIKKTTIQKSYETVKCIKQRNILKVLHQNSLEQSDKRQKLSIAYLFYQRISQMKLIMLLKKHQQMRKQQRLRQLRVCKIWAKKVKQRAMVGFKAYTDYNKEKKSAIEQAFVDRERWQMQQVLFKIQKVGQYWKQNQCHGENYIEIKQKRIFLQWKYLVFNDGQLLGKIQLAERVFKPKNVSKPLFSSIKVLSQADIPLIKPEIQQSKHEVLDWLKAFDKPQGNPQVQSSTGRTYLDRKIEDLDSKHRLKLREFDNYLSSIKTSTSTMKTQKVIQQQVSMKLPQTQSMDFQRQLYGERDLDNTPQRLLSDWNTPTKSTQNYPQQQNYSQPKVMTNFTNLKNTSSTRVSYIQQEIQQFLKDKELLRQLEANDTQSTVSQLLREEVKNKSTMIKSLCDELKELKNKSDF